MVADRLMTEMKQKEAHHNLEKERLKNATKQAEDYAKEQAKNNMAFQAGVEHRYQKMKETVEEQYQGQMEELRKQTANQVQI